MKKLRLKILILTMTLILLTLSLSACGLFGLDKVIKQVDVTVDTGLILQSDGTYEAGIGEDYVLTANWNNSKVTNPTIIWYKTVNDGVAQEISGETKETLTIKFTALTSDKLKYSAKVNGINSKNTVTVCVRYASVKAAAITSTSDDIINGKIQQNANNPLTEIVLSGSWNEASISPTLVCSPKWYVGDDTTAVSETKEYRFTPTILGSEQSKQYVITFKVIYGAGANDFSSSTLTVDIVRIFKAVSDIKVSVANGANAITGDTSTDNYVQKNNEITFNNVTLNAETYPLGQTNLATPVVWTLRNTETAAMTNGEQILSATSRTIEFTPISGKNVLTATVDNIVSCQVLVYAMSTADYNAKSSYILDQFIWNGQWCDHYILDQIDLNDSVAFYISKHRTEVDQAVFLEPNSWLSGSGVTAAYLNTDPATKDEHPGAFQIAIQDAAEPGTYSYYATKSSFKFGSATVYPIPEKKYDTPYTVVQSTAPNHYSTSSIERTVLPIDASTKTMLVLSSDMLYRAVSWGYKPTFEANANGVALENLYNKARAVMLKIVDDNMTELQKMYAIYDWMALNVDYDYAMIDNTLTKEEPSSKYNAYYLEGVFIDKQAVCDGRAKAVSLMCGMEGIRSMRITGVADGGGHAWNKVLIDHNNDKKRDWFVVDTTWGDPAYATSSKNKTENLTYNYFLKRDSDLTKHKSTQRQPAATTLYA